MLHKWLREERVSPDGRQYSVKSCIRCGKIRQKAWNGYIYFEAGYDPVTNRTGDIGTFSHNPGNCEATTLTDKK